jgi:Tol biopolymer transport system component
MTPERDRQISSLFHAARELTAGQRAAFLAEACRGDDDLRREVEGLLVGDAQAGDFLRQPLRAVAADLFPSSPSSGDAPSTEASLPAGRLLGRYQILSRLGAGGMGEVFLAEDTQLDRLVAVKLLPAEFTSNAERVRRFIREAKSASALNHPNILTIHEIGQVQTETDGLYFIVTEYVDGQTLRERMSAGKIPLDVALDMAIQVAGALAVAHEAGIIHRDIKPENLMIRRDGYVKLLDFGLAKLAEEAQVGKPLALSTEPGRVMGTAQYMSPEQARGLTVDARTDVFSLGVVLYEIIAGRAPFVGVNAIEVMGAILNQEPAPLRPLLAAPGPAADELERIVAKALNKDRNERYQTSNDFLLDLKKSKIELDALTSVSGAKLIPGDGAREKRRVAGRLAAILLAAGAAIGVAVYYAFDRSPAPAPVRPIIVPFSSLPGRESDPDFSPDGNQLAFTWDGGENGQVDVYVKLIGAGPPLRLTQDPANEASPVWAPDGRSIAFIRSGQTGDTLLIIPSLGGPERKVFTNNGPLYSVNWSPDGKWLAVADGGGGGIAMISVETGEKRMVTKQPAPSYDLRPAFSPDGRQLAFVRDNGKIYLTAVTGGGEKKLAADIGLITRLAWTADRGEIIFDSGLTGNWTLWRMPSSGGEPEALFSEREVYSLPAISRTGRQVAIVERHYDTDIRRLQLPTAIPTSDNASVSMSGRSGGRIEIKGEAMSRFITSQRQEENPQFSPDGKKIAFVSNRSGSLDLWVCASDGGSPRQLTQAGEATAGSPRWSPDSRRLVYDSNLDAHGDLFMIDAEGGAPRRLTTESSSDILPNWSRDGAWIYFCSDRGGNRQIWKMPSAGGPASQLTRKGGFEAVEAPDGKTLYYSKGYTDGLWTVPSTGGEEHPVAELAEAGYWRSWTMTQDGIYFVARTGSAPPRPLKFFSFATRRVTQIGTVDKDPLRWVPGLAISPDGRWLLYAQIEQDTSTIMLVENFR